MDAVPWIDHGENQGHDRANCDTPKLTSSILTAFFPIFSQSRCTFTIFWMIWLTEVLGRTLIHRHSLRALPSPSRKTTAFILASICVGLSFTSPIQRGVDQAAISRPCLRAAVWARDQAPLVQLTPRLFCSTRSTRQFRSCTCRQNTRFAEGKTG